MSQEQSKKIVEMREQYANAVRMRAYRRRRFQLLTWDDAALLMMLRELRTGEKVSDR